MPTYAYACTECQHGMEVRQSFSDDALTTCPQCGGRLRKRFDNVGIVFKGSGFYRNDSRSTGASGGDTSGPAKGDAASSSGGSSSGGDGGSSSGGPAKEGATKTSDGGSNGSSSNGSSSNGSSSNGAGAATKTAKPAPASS